MEKFEHDDRIYFNYLDALEKLGFTDRELLYNFPAFVGSVNLARLFTFYEIFLKVKNISGDIADVGTYMGGSMFSFAKLVKIFEPYSNTRVHGFDWFKGQNPGESDDLSQKGKYATQKERINRLIDLQGFSGFVELHDINLTTELPEFTKSHPWIRFKIIFLDCGIADVMESTLENFWPLLASGGALILDHYNSAASPQESRIVNKYCGQSVIQQIDFSRSPTAFLIKS